MPKLIHETRDRIANITMNRPDARNAIDEEMDSLRWRAFEQFRDDADADVAIVTAAGDAFCAGADLKTKRLQTFYDTTDRDRPGATPAPTSGTQLGEQEEPCGLPPRLQ